MISRRQALTLGFSGAALSGLVGCGPNMPNRGDEEADGNLRFTWWGNTVRDELTRGAIQSYHDLNPDIRISAETGDWDGYWDKLATQTAGSDTPDILQMDEKYLTEYGERGILLDLEDAGLDTSSFEDSVVDTGVVPGQGLYAICAGINTPVLIANPDVFDAAGVEMPDDTTWTWDDLIEIATEISGNTSEGTFGVQQLSLMQAMFQVYMRQLGKNQWTTEGIGFDEEDASRFFSLGKQLLDSGGAPSASGSVEDGSEGLEQTMFATGTLGLHHCWSNEAVGYDEALGGKVEILRLPSMTGNASDAGVWYKSGQYFSISERSSDPSAAVEFVDWLVNSEEAGEIVLAERGVPGNLQVREHIEDRLTDSYAKTVEFINRISDEISEAPPVTPQGGAMFDDMLSRACEDMLFGRTTSAEAGEALYDEAFASVEY